MTAIKFVRDDGSGRRIRYIGVFGWRCSFSEGREEEKELLVNFKAGRGVRDSEVIVMGRAKRDESEVKVLKAVCRSLFAVRLDQYLFYWRDESSSRVGRRIVPVIPDCILLVGVLC